MKHLRKILLALVVVAMLVSAVATIAIAADSAYKGKLETAQTLLDEAIACKTVDSQSSALAAVYAYLSDKNTKVDPETEGYTEFRDSYNDLTVKCGLELYDAVYAKDSKGNLPASSVSSAALAKVYVHFAGATVIDGQDPTVTRDDKYVCSLCGAEYFPKADEIEAGLAADFTCANKECAAKKDDYVLYSVKYSDFVKLYESSSLDITEALIDKLYAAVTYSTAKVSNIVFPTGLSAVGYYDYVAIQTALRNYLAKAPILDYEAPVNDKFTGSVAAAEALLATLKDDATLEEKKTVVANVYAYLVATPVDPTTDRYTEFFAAYYQLANDVIDAMFKAVDDATDTNAKIAALTEVKTYLVASPISENFVNAFNNKVNALEDEYLNASESLQSEALIIDKEALITPTVYTGDIAALKELVDSLAGVTDLGARIENVMSVYNYIVNTPVDPLAEGYAEVIAAYVAERDAVIDAMFATLEEEKDPDIKLEVIVSMHETFTRAPLSDAAIDRYNVKVEELRDLCEDALALLSADDMKLPEFVIEEAEPNLSLDMINVLLSDIENALDLEAKMAAVSAMYKYITTAVVYIDENVALAFDKYTAYRDELTTALMAKVDVAEGAEAKLAALKYVRDYITVTPYALSVFTAYNAKVDEVLAEADRAAMKATYVIVEINDIVAGMNATDASEASLADKVAAKLAAIGQVYDLLMTSKFDASDDEANDCMQAFYLAYTATMQDVNEYIDAIDDPTERYEALKSFKTFVVSYPLSPYQNTVYESLVESTVANYTNVFEMISVEEANIVSVIDTLSGKIDEVNAKETLAEKIAAFKELYGTYVASTLDPTDSAEFLAAYAALCDSFTAELVASVGVTAPSGKVAALLAMADLIKAAPYSEEVIDAYIELYNATKNADYSAAVEAIKAAFPEDLVYVAPEGLVNSMDGIYGAELIPGTVECLDTIYKFLAKEPLNVGASWYADAIEAYVYARKELITKFNEKVDSINEKYLSDVTTSQREDKNLANMSAQLYALYHGKFADIAAEHTAAFSEMYEFLDGHCISLELVNAYNAKREQVLMANNSYSALHETARALYSKELSNLHNHLAACKLGEDVPAEIKQRIETLCDGFEYAELIGFMVSYDTLMDTTKTPVSIGKSLLNKITSYLSRYSIPTDYKGYNSFLQLYYDACEDYVIGSLLEIEALETTAKKIERLNAIKADIEGIPANEDLSRIFNAFLADLIDEYATVDELLLLEEELKVKGEGGLIVDPEYATDAVEKLNELLAAITGAENLEAKKTAFANIYSYITSTYIDTEAEGYAAFLEAYSAQRVKFTKELIDDTMTNAPTMEAKIAALIPIRDYLKVTPVEQATVDAYNAKVGELIQECKDNVELAGKINVTYVEIPTAIGQYQGYVSKMSQYESEIAIDVNATDFSSVDRAEVMSQIKKLHDYLRNPLTYVDPKTSAYKTTMANYEAKCAKFTELLMADFKSAETLDAKMAAFEEVYTIVSECVYSAQLVEELKAAVQTIKDGYTALEAAASAADVKIVSPFRNLTNLMKAIDPNLSLNRLKRAFEEFYTDYKVLILDVTDSGYEQFLKDFDKNAEVVTKAIFEAIDKTTTPAETYMAIIAAKEYIIKNPLSEAVINSYNTKLNEVKALSSVESGEETVTVTKFLVDKNKIETDVKVIEYYTGTVQGLNEILATITEASTLEEKKVAIKSAYEYVSEKRIDTAADGYAEAIAAYEAARDALVTELIKTVTDAADETAKLAALTSVREYLAAAPLSAAAIDAFNAALAEAKVEGVEALEYYNITLDEYVLALSKIRSDDPAAVKAALAAVYKLVTERRIDASVDNKNVISDARQKINAEVKALTDNAKELIDANAPISEYDYPVSINTNFNDGKMPWTFHHSRQNNNKNPDCYYEVKGGYLSLYYDEVISSGPYFEIPVANSEKGFVFEFDISVHAADTIDYISFGCTEDGLNTKARVSSNFMSIASGNISDGSGNTLITDAITRGEWTHIALVYIPETFSMKLYVDYEFISEYKLVSSEPIKVTVIRIQCGNSNRYASLDNCMVYQGTDCRNVDKFTGMSDADKFNYYVDYFQNEDRTPVNRNNAYQIAKGLLNSVAGNESCKDNIAILNSYDHENKILGAAREENLQNLVKLVSNIGDITTKNTAEKLNLIQNIEAFISTNVQLIPQSDARFIALREELTAKTQLITDLSNTKELLDALGRFKRATTLASMTRHSLAAASYYELCGFIAKDENGEFYVTEKYDLIKDDPKVTEFLTAVGAETLMEYYDSMPSVIAERTKTENSSRIIDCILFIENIDGYDATASIEDKKAFWEKNYDYINKYLLIIRGVIKNYDSTVEGVEEAIAVYDEINEYFFDKLQAEHIRVMNEQLDKYPLTDSYIEKKGICSFIEKYLENNDIDEDLEEIKKIIATYKVYSEEVEVHKSEYQALLDQNTVSFIAVVDRMKANENSYATLVALFNEANTNYYYSMNFDTQDEALKAKLDAAIVAFERYAVEIEAIELASAQFLDAADDLKSAKNRTQKYKALRNCAKYVDDANLDVDGVKAAVELYNAELAAYNAAVIPANEIVSEANETVCAVRSMSIAETVLSIIKNLFTK